MVTCRRDERARELGGKYGIAATLDNGEAAKWATTLVLMAKPQDIETLLSQIRAFVTPATLVITLRGGDPHVVRREASCPRTCPVVRVMSNVPVMVDEAMSGVAAGTSATGRASRHRRGAARLRGQGAPD
jgi:pyrroline-5-carboxylate reductase